MHVGHTKNSFLAPNREIQIYCLHSAFLFLHSWIYTPDRTAGVCPRDTLFLPEVPFCSFLPGVERIRIADDANQACMHL